MQYCLGNGKEKEETSKEQWCGGVSRRSAGSALNRRAVAVRKTIRTEAVRKSGNGSIFAEVLIIFILKDHKTGFVFVFSTETSLQRKSINESTTS